MNEILGLMKPGKRKDLATKFWKIVIQFVQFLVAGREIDPRTDMKMLLQLDAVCKNVTVVIKKPGRQGINKKLNDKIQNSPRMIRELIKNKNPTNPCWEMSQLIKEQRKIASKIWFLAKFLYFERKSVKIQKKVFVFD